MIINESSDPCITAYSEQVDLMLTVAVNARIRGDLSRIQTAVDSATATATEVSGAIDLCINPTTTTGEKSKKF